MKKALLIVRDVIVVALAALVILATVRILKAQDHYYEAGETAESFMTTDSDVVVESNMVSILFDGPGTDAAMIFFTADDTEAKAYAPLMHDLAAGGLDCIVVKAPLRDSSLGGGILAEVIRTEYRYNIWYVGGHGAGADTAGKYTMKHKDSLAGLVCLGGFPDKNMSMYSGQILTVYGSLDGLWDQNTYLSNASYFSTEASVTGGNFSQFCDMTELYEGDNMASIDEASQREQTKDFLLENLTIKAE